MALEQWMFRIEAEFNGRPLRTDGASYVPPGWSSERVRDGVIKDLVQQFSERTGEERVNVRLISWQADTVR